ncbi:MAG: hypothetical protein IBX57_11490 [Gammaproteobacteria bacterium]|nr:hypothetical protein [Gammaproteobacteria bacterium]
MPLSQPATMLLKRYIASRTIESVLFPWFDGKPTIQTLERTTNRLSRQWSRIFDYAQCNDLRFHDLRHEATSRNQT